MGTLTTFLNLFKPAATDTSDPRNDLSSNFDLIDAAVVTRTVRTVTTATTVVLADARGVVEANSGSPLAVTIPPNSSVAFPVGAVVEVARLGVGAVTVVAGAGVTIEGSTAVPVQHGTLRLHQRVVNVWRSVESSPSGAYASLGADGGLRIKEGANAKQGVSTLVAGTVTVANTNVTATSRILLTVQSLGTVTAPKAIAVTARTAGTSFVITSADATDTSVVAWEIFEPGS